MSGEDFAVQLMWSLIIFMVVVGALCVLDVLFRPRHRAPRDYRVPHDFADDQRRVAANGERARFGWRP